MNTPEQVRKMPTLVKLAVEIGPLGVFFFLNSRFGIFDATMGFMVAITVSLAVGWAFERRIPTLPLVTGIVVLVFGGLTLWLQDELFIKLKPTIVNSCFALAIFVGLALKRNYIKTVMGSMINMDDEGWRILAWRWGFFFIAMAVLNEFIWRNFSTDFWVSFKVFGFLPITFVFAMLQISVMNRHSLDKEAEDGDAA